MNVYAITAFGIYGGGMAIVAANNDSEAKALAKTIKDDMWNVCYGQPESIELLPCSCDGPARVLIHYEMGE